MYAKIIDGQVAKYPYTTQEMYEDNPNVTSITEDLLAQFNTVRVVVTGAPEIDHTKNVTEITPVFSAERSRWEQAWVVTDASAEDISDRSEAKAETIRAERNRLLAESDWTQGADAATRCDPIAWAAYRQHLCDITEQSGFPWSVEWPSKP